MYQRNEVPTITFGLLDFFIPTAGNNYKPHLLSHKALMLYTAFILLANILFSTIYTRPIYASSLTSSNIVDLTNGEREKHGLNSLTTNLELMSAAYAKANNMFEKQYWDHFGPNGETPWQFIKGAGYEYYYAGENLAKGFKTSEGVHQAWMASPTHRDNLLSPNYKEVGVAIVSGYLNGQSVILVVQLFGNQTDEIFTGEIQGEFDIKPSTENGETKSIKITAPNKGEVVTDPGLSVKGVVSGVGKDAKFDVTDFGSVVGSTNLSDGSWSFSKKSDWAEGEHDIQVVSNDLGLKAGVDFSIDSTPPKFKDDGVKVSFEGEYVRITAEIEGENTSIMMVSGDMSKQLVRKVNGVYEAIVEIENLDKPVNIIASDEFGNMSELDISEQVFPESFLNAGLPDWLVKFKTFINISFVIFILFLVVLDIYFYSKMGILREKLGSILSLGMWSAILIVGCILGFSGGII